MNKKTNKKIKIMITDALLAIVLLVLDQLTKFLAIMKLKGDNAFVILQDVLEFRYLENRGSAFGMFQNQKIFILLVGFAFMAVILWILFRLPEDKKYIWIHLCLTGIIAGGVGNMIDRFRFGFVVDFISFVLIHFPIFNVADCYIVISVAVLLFLFLFVYKEEELAFLDFKKDKKTNVDEDAE